MSHLLTFIAANGPSFFSGVHLITHADTSGPYFRGPSHHRIYNSNGPVYGGQYVGSRIGQKEGSHVHMYVAILYHSDIYWWRTEQLENQSGSPKHHATRALVFSRHNVSM